MKCRICQTEALEVAPFRPCDNCLRGIMLAIESRLPKPDKTPGQIVAEALDKDWFQCSDAFRQTCERAAQAVQPVVSVQKMIDAWTNAPTSSEKLSMQAALTACGIKWTE